MMCILDTIPRKDAKASYLRFLEVLQTQDRTDLGDVPFKVSTARRVLCNKCGRISSQVVNDVLKGRGCAVCASVSVEVSKEKYLAKLAEQNRTDLSQEEYRSFQKRRIKCNVCGNIYVQRAALVVAGSGCPKCVREKSAVAFTQRNQDLCSHLKGQRFGLLTVVEYENDKRSRNWKCLCQCGNITLVSTADLLRGNNKSCGCVKSLPQKEIADLLQSWGLEIVSNDRQAIPPLELDILIPSKKIAIEYCGLHWHGQALLGPAARAKHAAKTLACQKAGIRLITIFEDEWLYRKDAVELFLRAILGLRRGSVGARKCELFRAVGEQSEIADFIEKNHVLGNSYSPGDIAYCLKFEGRVVAAMTFKKEEHRWNLSRFCVGSLGVPGAASRMLSAFRTEHPLDTIVSFSDNRWSEGALYESIGFQRDGEVPPSYSYFLDGAKDRTRHHKFGFRRKALLRRLGTADDGRTEWELAQSLGYDRIWDCGLVRWLLSPKPQSSVLGVNNDQKID